MGKIKISIIIPVYNTSQYLERCIRSIITQSLKEIEIICVNDGSTDNSLEILEKLAQEDERIIIINKENEGVSKARNDALKLATGKYCLGIDSDDWIEQEYLKDIYEIAEEEEADLVITDYYYDFSDRKVYYHSDITKEIKISNLDCLKNIFLRNGSPAIWNKLLKREVVVKNNIFFPKGISIGEDLLFISKYIYFSKKIVKLNKAYLHYILYNYQSAMKSTNLKKLKEMFVVLKEIETFFEKKEEHLPISNLKINHLWEWIFSNKSLLRKVEFEEIVENFLLSFKTAAIKELKGTKIRICGYLLKNINHKFMLIFLVDINEILRNIKSYLKK